MSGAAWFLVRAVLSGANFWLTLAVGAGLTMLLYALTNRVLAHMGITL